MCLLPSAWLQAQTTYSTNGSYGSGIDDDNMDPEQRKRSTWGRDTTKTEHFVPTEFYQWHIDERLGTVTQLPLNDTLPHLFQNYNATEGMTGEYSILGNLGAPRYQLNFLDRPLADETFFFISPYSYFHTSVSNLLYTNTKSPLTNLQYHTCGTRENGQDRVRAYFATNINKLAGFGFKLDYLYGRGYYNNQANSQFGGTIFGYYRGEHYEMHAMASWEHSKMGENGGIENDAYITDPQSFPQSYGSRDIPTVLSSVWNRNDNQTYYLTHRYNLGFYRDAEVPDSLKPVMPSDNELLKARIDNDSLRTVISADTIRLQLVMDSLKQQWLSEQVTPQDFIPVSSIVHTLNIRNLSHSNYIRSGLPTDYLSHAPYYRTSYDDFNDETHAFSIRNTLGLQLREGFNKWAKAGLTLFAAHELDSYELLSAETNDSIDKFQTFRESHLSVGGEIQKAQGNTLHYKAGAELWVVGDKAGDLDINGQADLNFRLWKDTVHLEAKAQFQNITPAFFYRHYHSRTSWWDTSLDQETRSRIEGKLTIDRTNTSLRLGIENITGYTHFAMQRTPVYSSDGTTISSYTNDVGVAQQNGSIQVISASLSQNFHAGIFHWDNSVTWQRSSHAEVLPLPMVFLYTNPYIVFHIATVLRVELGADMRFFTEYYAPDYAPLINHYAVQDASIERTKVGNWPIINAYANFAIKRVRGYVNVKHANATDARTFWAPHYPIDPMSIHFGISWNFYD